MRHESLILALAALLAIPSCASKSEGALSMHIQRGDQLAAQANQAFQKKETREEGKRLSREALAAYQAALTEAPGDGKILFCIGAQHFNLGQLPESIASYEKAVPALQREGKQELLLKAKGYLAGDYLQSGRKPDAVRLCDEVLAVDPKNDMALQIRKYASQP